MLRLKLLALNKARFTSGALEGLILVAAATAATVNITWGLPESWPPDEVTWIVNRMVAEDSANPRSFYYPSLMVNTCYALAKILTTVSTSALGMLELGIVCRAASAGFFVLTAFFFGRTIAAIFDQKRAPLATFFMASTGVVLHHAHAATVNSCFFFTVTLTLYWLVRFLKSRAEIDSFRAAAACGLAVGTKYNAVFLAAGILTAWAFVFRPLFSARVARHAGVSILLASLAFLVTTPFALLDFGSFRKDLLELLFTEGPAFKTRSGLLGYLRSALGQPLGVFSWPTACVMGAWLAAGVLSIWRVYRDPERRADVLLRYRSHLECGAMLGATLACFHLMNVSIGIFHSRYAIPGLIVLSMLFFFAWRGVALMARGSTPPLRTAATVSVAVLILFNSLNSYAHVRAFPASAKSRAVGIVRQYASADPAARFGVVAVLHRSPVPGADLVARTDMFLAAHPVPDVETWEEYLEVIGAFFESRRPRYIVMDIEMAGWPVFLPKKYANEPGKRLQYPNPGLAAWEEMFARRGYRRVNRVDPLPFPGLL